MSITQNTFQLYFNYKIQITFVKATKYKIQNTLNAFKIHAFQLLIFQLLQHCLHCSNKYSHDNHLMNCSLGSGSKKLKNERTT